jgi:hypothetical protein
MRIEAGYVRSRGRRWSAGLTILFGLLVGTCAPCLAEEQVVIPGQGWLSVRPIGLDLAGSGPHGTTRALAWTFEEVSGARHMGVVPATLDPSPDATPVLVGDPRSGDPVLIWSRWDGAAMKLAWTRFSAGAWSEAHDLTFGPGNDLSPAVGLSSGGVFLFWLRDDARVFFAPIDLGSGRLFSLPHPLQAPGRVGSGPAPEGGTDAPIIIGNCVKPKNEPCVGANQRPGPTTDPPPVSPEGGTDVPIVYSSASYSVATLGVTSDPSCAAMVLSFSDADGTTHSVAFTAGQKVSFLGRYTVADGIAPGKALAASGSYLIRNLCR